MRRHEGQAMVWRDDRACCSRCMLGVCVCVWYAGSTAGGAGLHGRAAARGCCFCLCLCLPSLLSPHQPRTCITSSTDNSTARPSAQFDANTARPVTRRRITAASDRPHALHSPRLDSHCCCSAIPQQGCTRLVRSRREVCECDECRRTPQRITSLTATAAAAALSHHCSAATALLFLLSLLCSSSMLALRRIARAIAAVEQHAPLQPLHSTRRSRLSFPSQRLPHVGLFSSVAAVPATVGHTRAASSASRSRIKQRHANSNPSAASTAAAANRAGRKLLTARQQLRADLDELFRLRAAIEPLTTKRDDREKKADLSESLLWQSNRRRVDEVRRRQMAEAAGE